jgi:hypothetical protein
MWVVPEWVRSHNHARTTWTLPKDAQPWEHALMKTAWLSEGWGVPCVSSQEQKQHPDKEGWFLLPWTAIGGMSTPVASSKSHWDKLFSAVRSEQNMRHPTQAPSPQRDDRLKRAALPWREPTWHLSVPSEYALPEIHVPLPAYLTPADTGESTQAPPTSKTPTPQPPTPKAQPTPQVPQPKPHAPKAVNPEDVRDVIDEWTVYDTTYEPDIEACPLPPSIRHHFDGSVFVYVCIEPQMGNVNIQQSWPAPPKGMWMHCTRPAPKWMLVMERLHGDPGKVETHVCLWMPPPATST